MTTLARPGRVARASQDDNNALVFSELLEPYQGRLLVACSGGADSTSLAHAVMRRSLEQGEEPPHLVYVHHGLRPEADEEGQRVADLASNFGSQAYVRRVQLASGRSLEAEARRVRYQALAKLGDELLVDWILLGHTASDQAETVLMRILRGTGLVGLSGMAAERERYARPFLRISRSQTENYCREHGLDYVEDAMNRQNRFTRVRIRHSLLPALRAENPQIESALCRLADSARDHRQVLEWACEAAWRQCMDERGYLRLGGAFADLPQSLAIQVLARHAQSAGVTSLDARHLGEILRFASGPAHGSAQLSLPGATLLRVYDWMHYAPEEAPIRAACVTGYEERAGYHLRRWQAGDRMRPARLKGRSKKLSDLFGDAKLPRSERDTAIVVVRLEDAEIVWAEHIGPAFGEKIAPSLKRK